MIENVIAKIALVSSLHEGCLLRGMRIYIPRALRGNNLEEPHKAHFGISRMESLTKA